MDTFCSTKSCSFSRTKWNGGKFDRLQFIKQYEFLYKNFTVMNINILNAQTNFQVSICKTLDVTRKKNVTQIYKRRVGLETGENSFASN